MIIKEPKVVAKKTSYMVVLQGVGGMLQNQPPDMGPEKASKAKQTKENLHANELNNWKDKLYLNGDDVIQRSEAIHQCIQDGASYWGAKIPGEGMKKYANIVKCGILVEDGSFGIKKDDPSIMPFGKACNPTPTKGAGGKVYKVRPMINPWELTFVMHVFDSGRLTKDVLLTILSYAGTYIGLSDWRPTYGRFNVVEFDEV